MFNTWFTRHRKNPRTADSQTSSNLTSLSNEVHARAPTPSLIHGAEKEPTQPRLVSAPTPFTPQDAIIAQVFGKTIPPASPPQPPHSSTSLGTSASLPSIPVTPPSRPTFTIYDPFSGAKLSEHRPMSPSTTVPAPADDRRLWSSLERILELQAEIAAMHAEMEGVGGKSSGNNTLPGGTSASVGEGGNVGPRKRSRRGQTLPIGDEEPEEPEQVGSAMGRAASEISTDHSDGEDEDADEYDIHGYGKKRRDEEFARLADQFAQRKAAIGGIMNKLDALSTALKTFHTVPAPLFDLAKSPSRTDTLPPTPSSASATSSPPPGRLLSGLSPFSPSRTAPVTPPTAPLSPPVPPISTLAPRASSSAPTGLAPIVAPILPPTALPMILPDAPHVESPAEVELGHSLLSHTPNTGL